MINWLTLIFAGIPAAMLFHRAHIVAHTFGEQS